MKAGLFLLALAWFSGSAYAGYRLTERSFAWIDAPNFGLPVESGKPPIRAIDFGVAVPPEALDLLDDLTPAQALCLKNAAESCLE